MYQDDFCVRNCELLSICFLQKSQIYKHITHSPDNSIISAGLHFVQFRFLFRPGHGPIYEGGGGGNKPKLREDRKTKDIIVQKMPENTERSDYQCETPKNWIKGRLFSKVVGGNVR